MDCPTQYNLPPDFVPGAIRLCFDGDGFGNESGGICDHTETEFRFPFGGSVTIQNFHASPQTLTITQEDGGIVYSGTLEADEVFEWPEDEFIAPIGIYTVAGGDDTITLTIHHPGAVQLKADDNDYGCCRTSIRMLTVLNYKAFQDFDFNLYPQYLRKITTMEFYGYTTTRKTYGSGGSDLPSGTAISGVTKKYAERYRQPVREVLGRDETVYTPDDGSFEWFNGIPGDLGKPHRHEYDDTTEPGHIWEWFYWPVPVGSPTQVSAVRTEQEMEWRFYVTRDGEPPPPPDDVCTNSAYPCDGGTAGIIVVEYDSPFTVEEFCEYAQELLAEEHFDEIEYPFTEASVNYDFGTETVFIPEEDHRDPYFDIYTHIWPYDPLEYYSAPGVNQTNPINRDLPAYNYIFQDNGTSISGRYPSNANSEDPVFDIAPFDSLWSDDGFPTYPELQKSALLDALTVSVNGDPEGAYIAVQIKNVKRFWSAPFCQDLHEEFWEDWIEERTSREKISCTQDLEGDPRLVTPCGQIKTAYGSAAELITLLEDWFEILNDAPTVRGRFTRTLSFTCPDVDAGEPCGCPQT